MLTTIVLGLLWIVAIGVILWTAWDNDENASW